MKNPALNFKVVDVPTSLDSQSANVNSEIVPRKAFKTLYSGIAETHLSYSCSVWGCCGLMEISHLQKLQNAAAREVTISNYDAPSKPLIQELGWKKIEELISLKFKQWLAFSKPLNGETLGYKSSIFCLNSSFAPHCLRTL